MNRRDFLKGTTSLAVAQLATGLAPPMPADDLARWYGDIAPLPATDLGEAAIAEMVARADKLITDMWTPVADVRAAAVFASFHETWEGVAAKVYNDYFNTKEGL